MSQFRTRTRSRAGMTLLEVSLALTIMAGTLIGLAEFGRRFANSNGLSAIHNSATDLAGSRVELAKAQRSYAGIDTLVSFVSSISGYPGYQMRTEVARTNTSLTDYKIVTVTLTHSRIPVPVTKTTAIAAF